MSWLGLWLLCWILFANALYLVRPKTVKRIAMSAVVWATVAIGLCYMVHARRW